MNSLEGPAMTILQDGAVLEARSIHEALHQGLVKILVKSSRRSLHDLRRSFTGPLQKVLWRSW